LEYLKCSNNKLTFIPQLPDSLQFFSCNNNTLTFLPNIPNLSFFYFGDNGNIYNFADNTYNTDYINNNNTLFEVYPLLANVNATKEEQIQYVNTINTQQKCKEWLATVNQHNIFLEIYERKVMNPAIINQYILANNENLNINEFMDNYTKYL
jgi:hypothetical protein